MQAEMAELDSMQTAVIYAENLGMVDWPVFNQYSIGNCR